MVVLKPPTPWTVICAGKPVHWSLSLDSYAVTQGSNKALSQLVKGTVVGTRVLFCCPHKILVPLALSIPQGHLDRLTA